MRRGVGLVLLGLGVFLLVLAPLLRWSIAPALAKAPLDQDSETVSVATNATYLDPGALAVRTGRNLVATRTVHGDVEAGSADVAVWDVFVKVQDPDKPGSGEDQLVTATTDRVAFDRRTSEAVDCCGANVNGDESIRHAGIEYKFPFNTEKKTYQYFDTTIGRATDMVFESEESVGGVETYKFVQRIEPSEIARLDVPGALVGSSAGEANVGRFYSNTRTVFVEPVTGVIVRGEEQQFATLRDDSGEDKLTITEANLAFNDETVAEQADTAQDGRRQIRLLTTVGPLIALIAGLILVGVGLFLLLRRTPTAPDQVPGRQPETVG
jgi:hypothetical protein